MEARRRIFVTGPFERFAKKQRISNLTLIQSIDRAESGLIDAALGSGLIKQRIARPGQGRSKGYRAIILYREEDWWFFVHGFEKSSKANVGPEELEMLKQFADFLRERLETEIDEDVRTGALVEIIEEQ